MEEYWNKGELLTEVEKRTGFRIAPITLWTWEKKGKFSPSGYMMNGKQKRPVYTEGDLLFLVERAMIAKETNNPRIKL